MRFLHYIKNAHGFRIDKRISQHIIRHCPNTGLGSLYLDIMNLSTRQWQCDVKAIWSSGKLRIIDGDFISNNDDQYLIEVTKINERERGEIFR